MKRFISVIFGIFLCVFAIFADEPGDEYDDGYIYEQNGAGDQFLKIELAGIFPLNFGNKIYPGGALSIGYYRFVLNNFALGGDVIIGYNLTIGQKSLAHVPVTFGAMFQPTVNKFEFPIFAGVGFASVSSEIGSYFPAWAFKVEAGAFYRALETWSFGISSNLFAIPQFFTDKSKNDVGIFCTANLSARYHF